MYYACTTYNRSYKTKERFKYNKKFIEKFRKCKEICFAILNHYNNHFCSIENEEVDYEVAAVKILSTDKIQFVSVRVNEDRDYDVYGLDPKFNFEDIKYYNIIIEDEQYKSNIHLEEKTDNEIFMEEL